MATIRALMIDELGFDPDEPWPVSAAVASPLGEVASVASSLPLASVAPARRDGEAVAVVRTATGRLYVLPDRCPHDGGPISDGFVEGEQVVCARHGWEIDACTGTCGRVRS